MIRTIVFAQHFHWELHASAELVHTHWHLCGSVRQRPAPWAMNIPMFYATHVVHRMRETERRVPAEQPAEQQHRHSPVLPIFDHGHVTAACGGWTSRRWAEGEDRGGLDPQPEHGRRHRSIVSATWALGTQHRHHSDRTAGAGIRSTLSTRLGSVRCLACRGKVSRAGRAWSNITGTIFASIAHTNSMLLQPPCGCRLAGGFPTRSHLRRTANNSKMFGCCCATAATPQPSCFPVAPNQHQRLSFVG